jgi:NRPS condensation-like uncharacterized protein
MAVPEWIRIMNVSTADITQSFTAATAGPASAADASESCCASPISTVSVFPLPLSEFEHYMLTDDRPSHPMVIVMLVDGHGSLHESLFRAAVHQLVNAHPLLNARIQNCAGQLQWVAAAPRPDGSPSSVTMEWHVTDNGDPQTQLPLARPLNLHAGECLRLQVWTGSSAGAARWRMALEVHHACADGIAAVQLIAELLARYGRLSPDGTGIPSSPNVRRQPDFETPRPELLPGRSNLPDPEPSTAPSTSQGAPRRSPGTLIGKLCRLFLRRPVRLASSHELAAGSRTDSEHHPAILLQTLSESSTARLRTRAIARGVTVNDLLLLQCLQQIRAWNTAAGTAGARQWMRIAVPISMRSGRHSGLPACNRVSYALVTHRMSECSDPQSLLQRIHEKTAGLMSGREGVIAWKLFRALRRIPGGLRYMMSWWSCAGTLVLANVGDIRRRTRARFPQQDGSWQAGSVVVDRICGVSPVRPNTLAAIGVAEYGGRMTVSLRTDGTMLTRQDSELFLRQFCERLESEDLGVGTRNAHD